MSRRFDQCKCNYLSIPILSFSFSERSFQNHLTSEWIAGGSEKCLRLGCIAVPWIQITNEYINLTIFRFRLSQCVERMAAVREEYFFWKG
jgi:hypothetical protein